MRFLQTADWHLGRKLHGFDLQAEQEAAFVQIEKIALQENVDGIIIAGDIYDRSMPAEQTVDLANQMLQRLNLTDHLPLYAIAGNHDSASRLATGTPWFSSTNFYLHTQLAEAFEPIELETVQIFLLPYFEPFAAQQYFADDSLLHLDQAMAAVINKIKQQFDPNKKHLLVGHFFAAGSSQTASETRLTVGGLAPVPIDLLTDFDYVALGHLHNKDALQTNKIRYSGSPLKFSLSEVRQQKGVFLLDTETQQTKFYPIKPLHDLHDLQNEFAELTNPSFYQSQPREDFFGITLTDQKPIPNVLARLREIYPKIVALQRTADYSELFEQSQSTKKITQQNPLQLLGDFYQQVANEQLSAAQIKWAQKALQNIREEAKS